MLRATARVAPTGMIYMRRGFHRGRLTAAPTDVPGRSGILCRLTRKNRREGSPLSGGFALHCYFTVSFTALEVTLPAALVTVQRYLYPFFVFFAVKE